MQEIHGVADATRMAGVASSTERVTVTDGHGLTVLSISDATFPAGLTPERARFIAKLLIESALRIEKVVSQKQQAKPAVRVESQS